MYHIHLVGAGALGSVWASEFAKRSLALEFPFKLTIYDFDTVEKRNVVAQDFDPNDINKLKADVVAAKVSQFELIQVNSVPEKLLPENVADKMVFSEEDKHIVVDAVDNFAARHLLWWFCAASKIPLLHMGMDRSGTGFVSWTYLSTDTFNLSPKNMSPSRLESLKKAKELEPLPPCELNTFRNLILNTALRGVEALFLFLGRDPAKVFGEALQKKPYCGTLSTWNTDIKGWSQLEAALNVEDF